MRRQIPLLAAGLMTAATSLAHNKIERIERDGYVEIRQTCGPTLGYNPASGVKIIEVDGLAFKNFDGSGVLKPYEDWRLPAPERAADLASRLTLDEIAGLMLYSPQNKIPMLSNDTYGGADYAASGAKPWTITDNQRRFLLDDNVRHVLVSQVESPEAAARWNNAVQALVEGTGHGIPANNSSDPRHSAFSDAEFSPGAGGSLSQWSHLLGLAATFDPAVVREFGRIASQEYRALGLATALSPQIDLGTDPRWYRFSSTWGNEPALVTDLARAYVDGFQGSGDDGGWGIRSVNAMVKHWPGGGSGEGGRDAHYGNGKYAVYPGGCFREHIKPFVDGAFKLEGKTVMASAVMPYYTISYGVGQNVGNSFDSVLIKDMLRGEAGFDGVVCTDWVITDDPVDPGKHWSKPWGVEDLTVAQRHYRALMAGVDQFGGNQEKQPVIDAYAIGCREHGEQWMRRRMEQSAARLLLNSFRPGLFENPYVDVEHTMATVGNPDFMKAGYDQQLKSVIMLKNHAGTLPLKGRDGARPKVYLPQRTVPEMVTFWMSKLPAKTYDAIPHGVASKYFDLTDDPSQADAAIIFMESPRPAVGWGYSIADREAGGNGYMPVSMQYRPYTAVNAREHSIAADAGEDRSYRGKSTTTQNECDLDQLEALRGLMGDKPVIVVMNMINGAVMGEVEPLADAVLTGVDIQMQAFLDIISGRVEPSGLLPYEMPASMDAIEAHCEDKPHDIAPYVDADGRVWKFGYGLDWNGPISDWRTDKYVK